MYKESDIAPVVLAHYHARSQLFANVQILMFNSTFLVTDKRKSFLIKVFPVKYRCLRGNQGQSEGGSS